MMGAAQKCQMRMIAVAVMLVRQQEVLVRLCEKRVSKQRQSWLDYLRVDVLAVDAGDLAVLKLIADGMLPESDS